MQDEERGTARNARGTGARVARARPGTGKDAGRNRKGARAAGEGGKEPDFDAVLSLRSLGVILRHGLRFANMAIPAERWVECMGFLLGDVRDDVIHIKDAVPITNGSKVEVRFTDEQYRIADEINSKLSEDMWVVGWYHTHPGHDLFLSTIDKVNHAGYQALNPKAVALVFDPSKLDDENSQNLGEYMRLFRLKDPSKLGRSDYDELESIRLEGSFSDMVDAIREIAEAVQQGHPVLLEYEEIPPPSIQSLEELVNRTFEAIQEIKRDVRDLKAQQKVLEKQVTAAVSGLIDDEELE
ncbi:MAG TPA: hypothetical protein EYP43_04675 [Thermoplasmata archaeon]|nr:hypothetical protein [Thermoplasmata archaeon]